MRKKEVSNIEQNAFTSCLEIKKVQPFDLFISKGETYGIKF